MLKITSYAPTNAEKHVTSKRCMTVCKPAILKFGWPQKKVEHHDIM